MNTRRITTGNTLFMAVIVIMSLLGGWARPAGAVETCTWIGTTAIWETSSNWSCGHVPTVDDNVIIPDVSGFDPVFNANSANFRVAEIIINSGAKLTVSSDDGGERKFNASIAQIEGSLKFYSPSTSSYFSVSINVDIPTGVVSIGLNGEIYMDSIGGFMRFYSSFNNYGLLHHRTGADCGVLLKVGGNHGGIFNVKNIMIQATNPDSEFVFAASSQLNVPDLNPAGGKVYIHGGYNAAGELTLLIIDGGVVEIDSVNVIMPYQTVIGSGATLKVTTPLSMRRLGLAGTFNNLSAVEVTTLLNWQGGGFIGGGTTTVLTGNTSSIYPAGGGTMDAQTLTLNGITNWTSNNIALSNGAKIINNGTFNANATTTMTGTEMEIFTNNGSFIKNTAATTTTMNIPFTNDGTVDVVAGSLVFQQGMDNGENAVIDLGGGTLDPGDELNLASGDILIGSGTLAADLVNGGTVSPGASPGIITVQGTYTQEADGILEIELSGTTSGTGHDQLVVTGAATLSGILNVSLINGFEPQLGDTFFIVDHPTSGTGNFSVENLPVLPGGLMMEINYADPGVTLTVVSGSTDTLIFLPMIVK